MTKPVVDTEAMRARCEAGVLLAGRLRDFGYASPAVDAIPALCQLAADVRLLLAERELARAVVKAAVECVAIARRGGMCLVCRRPDDRYKPDACPDACPGRKLHDAVEGIPSDLAGDAVAAYDCEGSRG